MTSRSFKLAHLMVFATTLGLTQVAFGQAAPMPREQQNALVQQYCAVCHSGVNPTGGISFEKFDAASPDPGRAAMMASKVRDGAMSAAGIAQPDRATIAALLSALSLEAAGSDGWTITRTQNGGTQTSTVTADVVTTVPGKPDLYRLMLTCNLDSREAQMRLAWAPRDVPQSAEVSVAADAKTPFTFQAYEGSGTAVIYATKKDAGASGSLIALPERTLNVSGLLPGQTVAFPFGELTPDVRQTLSKCFNDSRR